MNRGAERDDLLAEIQQLYNELQAMPWKPGRKWETPEYRALLAKIRAAVDARKKLRGDEMLVVSDTCDENHSGG